MFSKELQPATEELCSSNWSGSKNGLRFRCKPCGHRLIPGDLFRLVYANGGESQTRTGNFVVCASCDDDDVLLLQRMVVMEEEAIRRFWWLIDDDRYLERWEARNGLVR